MLDVREFSDYDKTRDLIFQNALEGVKSRYPIENDRYKLELSGLKYDSPKKFTFKDQKDAIMKGSTLNWRLRGKWGLRDKATGNLLEEKDDIVAHVPWMTQRGTFINNGVEYTISSQQRLKPGIYHRNKDNGEVESMVNVRPGTGQGFKLMLNPEKGEMYFHIRQGKVAMYPVLKALGVKDDEMKAVWGDRIFQSNYAAGTDDSALRSMYKRLTGKVPPESSKEAVAALLTELQRAEVDPDVLRRTLGEAHTNLNPRALLLSSAKLYNLYKGQSDPDYRDALYFQSLHGPEDFFKERAQKDAGQLSRSLLWKITYKGNLSPIRPGVLTPQFTGVLLDSGLGQSLEEINPLEVYDQNHKVLRLGEGGIGSTDSVSDEAREVQPSHAGFFDPIRAPESEKIGLDFRLAHNSFKGSDGRLYSKFIDAKSGRTVLRAPEDVSEAVVAFPGEMKRPGKLVRGFVKGDLKYVKKRDVDYVIPQSEDMFSALSNALPFTSAMQGNRMLMGAKAQMQSLALQEPESPHVVGAAGEEGDSYELLSKYAGAIRANNGGRVVKVTPDEMTVQYDDGTRDTLDLYNNFAFNRKSYIHNTPMLQPGDKFKKGQLLSKSNYTDNQGRVAIGRNLRVAYFPYKGLGFEDGMVISESAAKKLTSEHFYQHTMDIDKDTTTSRSKFMSIYPSTYSTAQLKSLDDDGVVKPGTTLNPGDPIILAVGKKQPPAGSSIMRSRRTVNIDKSQTWAHDMPGLVTDVYKSASGINVAIKGYVPANESDKCSGRHGNKGIITKIVPDDQMPKTEDGKPIELIMPNQGVLTRANPATMYEALLGKIAEKTGKKYVVPGFVDGNLAEYVKKEMDKHGVTDTEDLYDPSLNRKIPKVFVGNIYLMKLHHTGESKLSARDIGTYTADMTPSKGGEEGSKRVGVDVANAVLSAGATEFLRDVRNVRGTKNDEWWRAFRLGYPPPTPKMPFTYKKFVESLKSAGINLNKDASGNLNLMALTDKDVLKMSKGELTSANTLNFTTNQPIKGGLFDVGLTGGVDGQNYSHIKLNAPIPHPVFEEPIRHLLGLTKKEYEGVIGGTVEVDGRTGPKAIGDALNRMDLKREIKLAHQEILGNKKSKRDSAVKRLNYLMSFDKQGMHPKELMISNIPVIPPTYRPIAQLSSGMQIVSDANYLYADLVDNNDNLKDAEKEFGSGKAGQETLNLYNSAKAVTGLGDPLHPKLKEKHVRGFLAQVFGKDVSPKHGLYQRKVLGSSVDTVGRGVITPNPSLSIDEVGLPEEMAWKVFAPFVIRRLSRSGMKSTDAALAVDKKLPTAFRALQEEMDARPVVINRAPTLHKFSIVGAKAIPIKGRAIQLNPNIEGGLGADHDGDSTLCSMIYVDLRSQENISNFSFDHSVDWLYTAFSLKKEQYMPTLEKVATAKTKVCHISEFPRGELIEEKDTCIRYAVEPGLFVPAVGPKGEVVLGEVSEFSVHPKCEKVIVTTRGGREIVVSSDHSLVGIDADTYQLVKRKPSEMQGKPVPVMKSMSVLPVCTETEIMPERREAQREVGWDHKVSNRNIDITLFDVGWFIGAHTGDGWVTTSMSGRAQVFFAGSAEDESTSRNWKRILKEQWGADRVSWKENQHDCYGYSSNSLKFCAGYDELGQYLLEACGHRAENKHLPDYFLGTTREFRFGLFSGLLDTDGTLCWCKKKNCKDQFKCQFATISEKLCDDVVALAHSLGVNASVSANSKTVAGNTAYQVIFSSVDIKAVLPNLRLNQVSKVEAAERLLNTELGLSTNDIVPVPEKAATEIANWYSKNRGATKKHCTDKAAATQYSAARRAMTTGYVSRFTFENWLKDIPLDDLDLRWVRLCQNKDLTWDIVDSVQYTGETVEMYDLTVPGPYTFVASNGIFLWDTVQIHVPAGDKAIEDIKDKMFPSRTLLHPRNFQIHYRPENEFQSGLYTATTAKRKQGRVFKFKTQDDAVKAYLRGEVNYNDVVDIEELKG